MYTGRGFKVVEIHLDREFKWIVDDMSPTAVKIVATDDHVDEVERLIRVVKERWRCIIELVCTSLRGLNQIPAGKGVSDRIIPLTIVTGRETFNYNKLQATFEKYTQLYKDNRRNKTNAQLSLWENHIVHYS